MNLWCGFMLALVAGTRTASAARQPGGTATSSTMRRDPFPGTAIGTGAGAGADAAEAAAGFDADDPTGAYPAPGRAPYRLYAA